MSDPSADSKPAGGAGAIIGIAAGLMIIATLAAFLIMSRGGKVDGAAVLERAFGVRGLEPRYAIFEAREMPSGHVVVILDDPSAPADAPPLDANPSSSEGVDWRKVVIPKASPWPRRIVFTLLKPDSGQKAVEAFLARSEWKDVADLGPKGGKVVVAAKKIAWRGFDADWVHERSYEQPMTFRDALSVNLSLEKQPAVMTAFWSRGEPASEATLKDLLVELGSDRKN